MIHTVTVNDKTKEGKLIIEMIRAIKPSKKSVRVSPVFAYENLV